ncbi:hypothetical protein ACQKFO_21570 [Rossellomorea sp. NPDC071047]|uniref:hypothetical protein n=1 Tax=Rossellomorea sp. NPDC071047 TaxID=3390675 RepID=UPI003CFCD051
MKQLDLFSVPVVEVTVPPSKIDDFDQQADDLIEHTTCSVLNDYTLKVNNLVQVLDPQKSNQDIEDYYYLKKFSLKIGTITKIYQCSYQRLSYEVDFNGTVGVFYSKDLLLMHNKT